MHGKLSIDQKASPVIDNGADILPLPSHKQFVYMKSFFFLRPDFVMVSVCEVEDTKVSSNYVQ